MTSPLGLAAHRANACGALGSLPPVGIRRAGLGQPLGVFALGLLALFLAQRAIAEGRGSSGTALDDPLAPGMGAGDTVEVAAAVAGGLPGSTTTRVPTRMRR
jgi:hypothetical protein